VSVKVSVTVAAYKAPAYERGRDSRATLREQRDRDAWAPPPRRAGPNTLEVPAGSGTR